MNKALIIIDAQKYFLNKYTQPKVKPIVNNIKKYLKQNLKKYSLVYFTIFRNDKNSPNKLANKIVEILMQSRAWKNYRVLHSVPTLDASQLKTLQSTLKFPLKNKLT